MATPTAGTTTSVGGTATSAAGTAISGCNISGGLQSCCCNGLLHSGDVILHVLLISIAKIRKFIKRVITLIIITVIRHNTTWGISKSISMREQSVETKHTVNNRWREELKAKLDKILTYNPPPPPPPPIPLPPFPLSSGSHLESYSPRGHRWGGSLTILSLCVDPELHLQHFYWSPQKLTGVCYNLGRTNHDCHGVALGGSFVELQSGGSDACNATS